MRIHLAVLGGMLMAASGAWAQSVPVEQVFSALRFERPVDLQHAGDLLFLVEQRGMIYVFDNDPAVAQATEFLDIRTKVSRASNEEGLLGLAFAPDYATSGDFYVYYSARSPRRSVIARYARSAADNRKADASSEEILLTVAQPYGNHNGGQLAFGPDNYLYIGLGDGGSAGDPQGHGQDRTTLLGSLLRIDVSTTPYSIPSDNPFEGNTSGYKEEIWAWGLRNPWRFSFDAPTGRLYAADVGQNSYEEVDTITAGGNYGWNTMEGPECYRPSSGCNRSGLQLPVHSYASGGQARSVTGGYVYHSTSVPSLQGKYIYADYVEGTIWAWDPTGSPQNTQVADTQYNISSFGQDRYGEVFILAFNGRIYRFSPAALKLNAMVEDQTLILRMPITPVVLPGATGGVVPYTYALSPDLPPGLSFDPGSRTITGTPTSLVPAATYTWEAADQAGRTASTDFNITIVESTGRGEEAPGLGILVHGNTPNPFADATDIVLDVAERTRVAVSVMDLLGRTVLEVPFRTLGAGVRQRIALDMANMPAGPYLYRVLIDAGGPLRVETGTMLRVH